MTDFLAQSRGIQDLTGLQFATNLSYLNLDGNEISNLSPLAGLINLRQLKLNDNPVSNISLVKGLINLTALEFHGALVSDMSPVAGLINLKSLSVSRSEISDLSPIAGLINLESLNVSWNEISDLSPIAGLINLRTLSIRNNPFSDISPVRGLSNLIRLGAQNTLVTDFSPIAGLTNLQTLGLYGNRLSDISPIKGLTNLRVLNLYRNNISDISPLVDLTGLKELYINTNNISDLSPLAGLTELTRLDLLGNEISDISPLAGLINLEWLNVVGNQIADFSPLDEIRENIKLVWYNNPGFPKGGPKIEGPWLWLLLPDTVLDDSTDLLSEASGGSVTEMEIATHGATAGQPLGDDVWTIRRLPPTGSQNIKDMLQGATPDGVIYGSVSLHSPQEQSTMMYAGSDYTLRVWLNGTLMYEALKDSGPGVDYQEFFPVTLKSGRNVLLVAVHIINSERSASFGFEPGTEYTVANPGISYTFSKAPIHPDDTFTLDIGGKNIFDLAGWQFDIAFDPAALEAISVTEGAFLKTDGGTTFFQGGTIDNATGKITGLNAARLSGGGASGTGALLRVRFKAKSGGETELVLQNFEFGAITGDTLPAGPHQVRIVVEGDLATGDVNRDGRVSILDLILVSQQLGKRVPAGSAVDVNGDGIVSILDLIRVSQEIGNTTGPAAPAVGVESVDTVTIAAWIAQARLEDDGSLAFKQGIENLEALLRSLIPEETALLGNYPNPFNPETWISYQLAESAAVALTIYDMNGQLVRHFTIGHQAAGVYQSRNRAAYWDGRNQLGESVASGLYFYTLTADEFTATRRMLILK